MKRKRDWQEDCSVDCLTKKHIPSADAKLGSSRNLAERALLKHFSRVTTLRDFILSKLPKSSKWRRRRLLAVPPYSSNLASPANISLQLSGHLMTQVVVQRGGQELSKLLDTTLVGSFGATSALSPPQEEWTKDVSQDYARFTQQQRPTLSTHVGTAGSHVAPSDLCQAEVVDFVVGRLFYKSYPRQKYPRHVLCHGYERSFRHELTVDNQDLVGGICGLDCMFPNPYVATLKSGIWQQLLRLMSREGDVSIMLDLLLNCGVFLPLDSGKDNYYQLSGKFISDLAPLASGSEGCSKGPQKPPHSLQRTPAEIVFVRSRMMHGRPALNRLDETRFGLPHIHVLNRCKDTMKAAETHHVAMYIFARQFGLHNVFMSTIDRRETAQPFKDYTLREEEIRIAISKAGRAKPQNGQPRPMVPKRLRGPCLRLVHKLRVLHQRCSYTELLKHYCSVPVFDQRTPPKQRRRWKKPYESHVPHSTLALEAARKDKQQGFVDFASPVSHVSSYCRAVLTNLIPNEFFGVREGGLHNRNVFMLKVHEFVSCNKFEKMTLHGLLQGQRIACIPWLDSAGSTTSGKQMSRTDAEKRKELYLEFLYFVFDSILIPLLRSTFQITESSQHGNRLFFFRHDVWRALVEPTIREIRESTFTELPRHHVAQLLNRRSLGIGQTRLMPKGAGVRMITNLRRRPMIQKNGRTFLGKSVNTQLEAVHCMLKCEKAKRPAFLGGSLFSVDEVRVRIKSFHELLLKNREDLPTLYFVKVDVKSCFDTIPQQNLLELVRRVCSEDAYLKHKHLELRPFGNQARRFVSSAQSLLSHSAFNERIEAGFAVERQGTVFGEVIMDQILETDWLLQMLSEHIQENIVRIGKKHFQQKTGIPQGSVLSTLLCSFFYADFERRYLGYLDKEESLLVRLIDDFLLITTNRGHAVQFAEQMHRGCDDYGIQVRPEKTLTNFQWTAGSSTNTIASECWFPWCGVLVHTGTLELSRDRTRRLASSLKDAITVERMAKPGASFVRKTLHAFRVQTNAMLTDTSINTPKTVLTTLYLNFVETAMKMHRYIKTFRAARPIDSGLIIGVVSDLGRLAIAMTEGRARNATLSSMKESGRECTISHGQIEWLLMAAFAHVLRRKQTRYHGVLAWLEQKRRSGRKDASRLAALARSADAVYMRYKF